MAQESTSIQTSAESVTDATDNLALVETILWEKCCGFWLLPEHLQRLKASADHFSFAYNESRILAQLDEVVKKLKCDSLVRLEFFRDGVINLSTTPSNANREPVKASPARQPVDSLNVWLRHSTSRREQYDQTIVGITGVDEVLLWNEQGEVIGSTTSNLVFELNGQYYTPPLECGVMPGVYRASLIQQGRLQERRIHLDELASCNSIYLINSAIGWREVNLVEPKVTV